MLKTTGESQTPPSTKRTVGVPTDDQEDDEADDEQRGAADHHSARKVNERGKKQGGPEQEVEQCPEATRGGDGGPGEPAFLAVDLL